MSYITVSILQIGNALYAHVLTCQCPKKVYNPETFNFIHQNNFIMIYNYFF